MDEKNHKSKLDKLAEGRKAFPKKGQTLEKYRQHSEDLRHKLDKQNLATKRSANTIKVSKLVLGILLLFAVLFTVAQNLKKEATKKNVAQLHFFEAQGEEAQVGNSTLMPADLKAVAPSYYVNIPRPFYPQELHDSVQKQKAFAQKTQLPLEVENTFGMKFRLVPPGKFMMGSPTTEKGHQAMEDLHEQEIAEGFYCGKAEISQEQWLKIMKINPSEKVDNPQIPVNHIAYYDAQNFVKKLNKKLDLPDGTYSLLSETEWEYSNRAGSTAAFPFGNNIQLLPYYAVRTSRTGAQAIYTKLPNAWGLYNTVGNMWEWTSTPFFYYNLPSDQFAYSGTMDLLLDLPIYDGDSPMDTVEPINNFAVENRTQGKQTSLYFADEDGNGEYSQGEFLWKEEAGTRAAIYDHQKDTLIYRGSRLRRDLAPFDGITGLQKGVYYSDTNNDNQWSIGESIWQFSQEGRDSSLARILRGGTWSMSQSKFFRSAQRWKMEMQNYSDMISLRIKRKLPKTKQ